MEGDRVASWETDINQYPQGDSKAAMCPRARFSTTLGPSPLQKNGHKAQCVSNCCDEE